MELYCHVSETVSTFNGQVLDASSAIKRFANSNATTCKLNLHLLKLYPQILHELPSANPPASPVLPWFFPRLTWQGPEVLPVVHVNAFPDGPSSVEI